MIEQRLTGNTSLVKEADLPAMKLEFDVVVEGRIEITEYRKTTRVKKTIVGEIFI